MAIGEQPESDLSAPDAPEAGEFIDAQLRTARDPGGGDYHTVVNLTGLGCRLHDITSGEQLTIAVYENGIWIPRDD